MRVRIDKGAYEEWALRNCVCYASTTTKGPGGLMYGLVFTVSVAGEFKVTRGLDTIYEGPSFDAAAEAFNAAA